MEIIMEIIPLSNELYETWDNFCTQSDYAWFWHTTDWLEYIIHLRPELKSQQKSFMVLNNNIPVAICPLILDTISDDGKKINLLSFDRSNGSLPALQNGLSSNQTKKILKTVFNYIDKIALELDVQCCLLKFSPLIPSYFKEKQYNYLMKFGFIDTTLNTQILDLSKDANNILNEMRKGHRYDIRRGEKVFNVTIFDKNSITKEIFDHYRILHHKTAGRVTRALITFEMMYKWILEGKAILCGASYNDEFVGFAFINIYKNGAYYSSASDDPDVNISVPFSHIIQWKVINWLKENRFQTYEIGLQQFNAQLSDIASKKDKSISFFKRGFGGYTAPLFRGEKYYSLDYFTKIQFERLKKINNSYKNDLKSNKGKIS